MADLIIIDDDDVSCPSSTTTLVITNTTYYWPVTMVEITNSQPCPSQPGVGISANVSHYCGGSDSSGGVWSDVDFSQCSVWVASILDNVTSQPEELQPEMVSEIIELTDTVLTEEAIRDPEVAEQYLDIIDNIKQVDASVILESEEQSDTSLSLRVIESLGRFQDEVVLCPNATNGSQVFTRERFAIQVRDIDIGSFNGETCNANLGSFEEALSLNTSIPEEAIQITMNSLTNITASIAIPPELITTLQQGANQSMETQRLSYSVFLTDTLFQSPNQTAQNLSIKTVIIAVRLREVVASETLTALINTSFRISEEAEGADSSNCVHWQPSDKFGEWSSDGCRVAESKGEERMCECSIPHQSSVHFAVIFDLNPAITSPTVGIALQVITYIGLVISILSLVTMISTYLYSKKLRTTCHGQIILNMSVSLLGLYIFFLIAAHVTGVTGLCGLVSALLHYFILVFFGWIAAEAVYLYIKLVKVLGIAKYEHGFVWKAGLITWILPALVVTVSMAGYQYYPSQYFCRPTQWPFFFGLILPFAVIYFFNWVMFFTVITSICKHYQGPSSKEVNHSLKDKLQAVKQMLISAVSLSLVFGLGWGFGLLATSSSVEEITITFQVVFSLFVGSQGLLLLIFHGFRIPEAREVWKQWFKYITCRHKKLFTFSAGSSTLGGGKRSTTSAGCSGASYAPPTASYKMATLCQTDPSVCASLSNPTQEEAIENPHYKKLELVSIHAQDTEDQSYESIDDLHCGQTQHTQESSVLQNPALGLEDFTQRSKQATVEKDVHDDIP